MIKNASHTRVTSCSVKFTSIQTRVNSANCCTVSACYTDGCTRRCNSTLKQRWDFTRALEFNPVTLVDNAREPFNLSFSQLFTYHRPFPITISHFLYYYHLYGTVVQQLILTPHSGKVPGPNLLHGYRWSHMLLDKHKHRWGSWLDTTILKMTFECVPDVCDIFYTGFLDTDAPIHSWHPVVNNSVSTSCIMTVWLCKTAVVIKWLMTEASAWATAVLKTFHHTVFTTALIKMSSPSEVGLLLMILL